MSFHERFKEDKEYWKQGILHLKKALKLPQQVHDNILVAARSVVVD